MMSLIESVSDGCSPRVQPDDKPCDVNQLDLEECRALLIAQPVRVVGPSFSASGLRAGDDFEFAQDADAAGALPQNAAASVKIPDLEGAEKIANFAERRSAHAARVTQLRGLRILIDIEEFGAAVVAADDEHRMAATM